MGLNSVIGMDSELSASGGRNIVDSPKVHDSSHWLEHTGIGWQGLVKPIVDYVDACHNLPNNGGHDFRYGTQSIVKFLWRHWRFPLGPLRRWRYPFIHWATKQGNIAYYGHEKGFTPEIAQVKEKFGTLRIYVDGSNDFLDGMVNAMELASGYICEDCGRPGTRRSGGWILTQCDECHGKKR